MRIQLHVRSQGDPVPGCGRFWQVRLDVVYCVL